MDFVSGGQLKASVLVAWQSQLTVDGFTLQMIQAPFASSLATTDADLTNASFVGYSARSATASPVTLFYNQARSRYIMQINLDSSSDQVETAGAIVGPQTMYGVSVHGGLGGQLFVTALYDTPQPVTAQGVGVVFPLEFVAFNNNFLV
jgi:hypothetical protein